MATALLLIDRDGMATFNMRQLSEALGVYPSAVYWHIPSRDQLISEVVALAMRDAVRGLGSGLWQERLRRLLARFRAALRRHPHLAPVIANELVYNASHDPVLLDHVVAALEDAGFEGDSLVDAFNVVIAAMCGFATLELGTTPADASDTWEASCRANIDAVDRDRHPALGRHLDALKNRAFILRWSSGANNPLERSFDAWMEVFIAGLEAKASGKR